jgi:hypothetical protein
LGVAHPSLKKAQQFKDIDLLSVKASANAAVAASVLHFIYVSVNQTPSGIMKAYQEERKEGESYCLARKLNCTFCALVRSWTRTLVANLIVTFIWNCRNCSILEEKSK